MIVALHFVSVFSAISFVRDLKINQNENRAVQETDFKSFLRLRVVAYLYKLRNDYWGNDLPIAAPIKPFLEKSQQLRRLLEQNV